MNGTTSLAGKSNPFALPETRQLPKHRRCSCRNLDKTPFFLPEYTEKQLARRLQ
ncbi:MAG: hypothetical protein HY074_18970 [Deltaproteobacteria bacterium]|nr:hypothetical protein [Deltaproteobacteria bacterium]